MRRSYLIGIVIAGTIIIVLTVIFLILRNPYEQINPPVATSETTEPAAPPTADDDASRELITVRETPTLGAGVGVDGVRLVFMDLQTSTLRVTEYDGTGEQSLSDAFVGVQASLLSPTRERAIIQVDNPDGPDVITLIYDLRTRDAVRLEDGIVAFDWSPDGSSIVYYVARTGSAAALRTVGVDGAEPQTLRDAFTLIDPVVDWYDALHVAFWQRPSADRLSPIMSISVDGREAFEISPAAAAQQARFSPDGTHVLISSNDAVTGKPVLALGEVAERVFATVPLVTWADKCTWSHDGSLAMCFAPQVLPAGFTFPTDDHDLNYQDELWTIAATTGKTQRVYQVPAGVPDATQPFASDNLARLNFLDRMRGALVSLDVADKVVPATAEPADDDAASVPDDATDGSTDANTTGTSSTTAY